MQIPALAAGPGALLLGKFDAVQIEHVSAAFRILVDYTEPEMLDPGGSELERRGGQGREPGVGPVQIQRIDGGECGRARRSGPELPASTLQAPGPLQIRFKDLPTVSVSGAV